MATARAVVSCDGRRRLTDVELGDPGPGQVVVALRASGLCHTDLYVESLPGTYVLGHEGAGVVESVGAGVAVQPGTRVLLNWAMPCGSCFQCATGGQHRCERQSPLLALDEWPGPPGPVTDGGVRARRAFGLGTMATRTVVPESAVWPIGDTIPFTAAAILGCGVMTGYGSVVNAARVAPGEQVVVIGCGGVGLSAIQAARLSGAARVIAIDVSAERARSAERFGATDVIVADPGDSDLSQVADAVRALTSGRGADHAFEATGKAALAGAPLRMIRHGGTAVQISGFDATTSFDLSLFMFDKTYVNPLYGQCAPARDFPRLIELYERGALLLDAMVTRTYTLDEHDAAFADLEAARNAKGVFVIE